MFLPSQESGLKLKIRFQLDGGVTGAEWFNGALRKVFRTYRDTIEKVSMREFNHLHL